jgi:hypothetical protein
MKPLVNDKWKFGVIVNRSLPTLLRVHVVQHDVGYNIRPTTNGFDRSDCDQLSSAMATPRARADV